MASKVCKKCLAEKPLPEFNLAGTGRNGAKKTRSICKHCQSEQYKEKLQCPEFAMKQKERQQKRIYPKRTQTPERVLATRKYQSSEKYKALCYNKYSAARESRLSSLVGRACAVTPLCCDKCGVVQVRKGDIKPRVNAGLLCTRCGMGAYGMKIKRPTIEKGCTVCGGTYSGDPTSRYCNDCGMEKKRLLKAKAKVGVACSLASRARKHGVIRESIRPDVVFDRDRYRCCECRCTVVRSKKYQPNQATVDHIVPLSMGGSHTYHNTRTLCMVCNTNKGNKMPIGRQLTVFDVVK